MVPPARDDSRYDGPSELLSELSMTMSPSHVGRAAGADGTTTVMFRVGQFWRRGVGAAKPVSMQAVRDDRMPIILMNPSEIIVVFLPSTPRSQGSSAPAAAFTCRSFRVQRPPPVQTATRGIYVGTAGRRPSACCIGLALARAIASTGNAIVSPAGGGHERRERFHHQDHQNGF